MPAEEDDLDIFDDEDDEEFDDTEDEEDEDYDPAEFDEDEDEEEEEPEPVTKKSKEKEPEDKLTKALGQPLEAPPQTPSEEDLVEHVTQLILAGSDDEVVETLYAWTTTRGVKWAKAIMREARDCAKAKVTRIHAVAQIVLEDSFAEDD